MIKLIEIVLIFEKFGSCFVNNYHTLGKVFFSVLDDLIDIDTAKCVGCNRCISVCPLPESNIAFLEDGRSRVRIDPEKCIHCGSCLKVCRHESRFATDDDEKVLSFLRSGSRFSVLAAPSIRTNFPGEWERILGTFRDLGANGIYDVSLGADICTWAHIRFLQENGRRSIISQPCPVVVNYICKYRHDLMDLLSPVHSPMLCTASYVHKVLHNNDKLIVLSPCVAKEDEFRLVGLDAYNFTFRSLKKALDSGRLRLAAKPGRFDDTEAGIGRIYSRPGGLKENIESYLGTRLSIQRLEGMQNFIEYLNEITDHNRDQLPDIIDVLNCPEGCNYGTGCVNENGLMAVGHLMDREKRRGEDLYPQGEDGRTALFEKFDRTLSLIDYLRAYSKESIGKPAEAHMTVEEAFGLLGKTTFEDRNFNCGACGSDSCEQMAEKITKGLNIPENCLWKMKHDLSDSSRKAAEFSREIAEDISQITDKLISSANALSEKNSVMSAFVKDVNSLAFTTRILSLNASIEAAHAGAAGRTFSVVADEIKTLADRSASASSDIQHSFDENNTITKDVVSNLGAVQTMAGKIMEHLKTLTEI